MMKIIAISLLIIALFMYGPFQLTQFDLWQLPHMLTELSWVSLELVGALFAIIAVIAIVALLSVGLLGAGIIIAIGVLLAMLFGSVMIFWPLLLIVCLYWLVVDNKEST